MLLHLLYKLLYFLRHHHVIDYRPALIESRRVFLYISQSIHVYNIVNRIILINYVLSKNVYFFQFNSFNSIYYNLIAFNKVY